MVLLIVGAANAEGACQVLVDPAIMQLPGRLMLDVGTVAVAVDRAGLVAALNGQVIEGLATDRE